MDSRAFRAGLAFALALALALPCVHAQPEEDEAEEAPAPRTADLAGMRVARNVAYAQVEGVDPNLLSLDAYAPSEGKDMPVMVFVHGGGWRKGDKGNGGTVKARHFVEAGWVYVSVNYRLSPAVRHPVHVQDVAAAIAHVHANVARWGGDPRRIHVMGHSAGAHLAALVATDGSYLKAHGLGLDTLRGVVLLDGAGYDIPDLLRDPRPVQAAMYKGAFGKDPEGWKSASPIAHVAADQGIPAFLILPIAMRAESCAQSERLAAALKAAGVRAEVRPAPGKTHGTINSEFGFAGDEPTGQAMEFLRSLGAPPKEETGTR